MPIVFDNVCRKNKTNLYLLKMHRNKGIQERIEFVPKVQRNKEIHERKTFNNVCKKNVKRIYIN